MYTFSQIIDNFNKEHPLKTVVRDETRKLNYQSLSINGKNLSNYFISLGIEKGDRVAFLAYNCIEFAEVLYATSKIGAIVLPINFRLSDIEIKDILLDSTPKILIHQKYFRKTVNNIIKNIKSNELINLSSLMIDDNKKNICSYKAVIKNSQKFNIKLKPHVSESWSIMYTSGTTGKPKGVVRSHAGYHHLSKTTSAEINIKSSDNALLVMPLCHANSFNFFCAYITAGASVSIYSKKSFDAEHFFNSIKENGATFTSLVPTHFIMLLDYLKKIKNKWHLDRPLTFMISSAPVRIDTKKSILNHFKKAKLFELYGSSESGWVTMLHPKEQFKNMGTVGKECIGTSKIKLLDKNFNEVKDGEIGELFAKTPYNFSHYWKNDIKTKAAFFKDYVTVGDLARRNTNGFIELIDRKKNMIISGGENIYPAEVENIIGSNRLIKDLAIVGYPDKKWGEIVCCFAILEDGAKLTAKELITWSKEKIARYKCPKKVFFIKDIEMPRNSTGKILHKVLRERAIEMSKKR